MCVLIFLQLLSETFVILRELQPDVIINVHVFIYIPAVLVIFQ
jgi:UDP-N-acetylglucosamine:LPS N-acetylglucosamine transferase